MAPPSSNTSTPPRRRRPLLLATAAVLASATGRAASAFSAGNHRTKSSTRSVVNMSGISGGGVGSSGRSSSISGGSTLPQQLLLERTRAGAEAPPPSSPLRMICDEQNEFQMAVGRAVDTLRTDYPDLLTENPDFSIYHKDIEVVDPSGVTLHGLRNYKTSFRFMHALVNFFYCPAESGLTFRLVYDWARNNIRVSWNAILIPRSIYGGVRNRLHVDGISVYEFDRASGLITKHRIEHLLLNDAPVRPVNGVFNAMQEQAVSDGIPVLGVGGPASSVTTKSPFTVEFRQDMGVLPGLFGPDASTTSLFSASGDDKDSVDEQQQGGGDPSFDEDAFHTKNVSRKKFGLAPLTPLEFTELQAQVRKMERDQKRKAASTASAAAELAERKKDKKNALANLFGSLLEDTCESNFDCQRPEVCCDFGFKKMCCTSGMKVFDGVPGQQRQLLRVPVESDFPRGGPDGNGGPVSGY